MRTFIFGGSFNPVHTGHLFIVQEVMYQLGYERAILVPANIASHKENHTSVTPQERLYMLHAAVDDGILDVPFRVSSFEMVFFDRMGNAIPMASEGAAFSQRQKDALSKLAKNRRCYISRIKAAGPDGTQRTVNGSMEIIIK